MMRVLVIEPPAPIVSYEDAVARLRLDGDDDERTDVEAMIATATAHIDGPGGWLGRAIGVQTIEARLDCFDRCHGGSIFLLFRPVVEIVSVSYLDESGTVQTIDPTEYELLGHELVPAWQRSWPKTSGAREAVRVRYTAGYETVPAPIIAAILLMVGDLYSNRQTVETGLRAAAVSVPMSTTVETLLAPYRVVG